MAEVPWQFGICILCLDKRKLTLEHIIPKQIGGQLTARFLCKPCNDRLGHEIEAKVRADPSIRLAGRKLSREIPDLAKAIEKGQPYVGLGPGGKIRGVFKNGSFHIRPTKKDNMPDVLPTAHARERLKGILARQGTAPAEIDQRLAQFDQAPNNMLVDLGNGLQAVRWSIDETHPALEGPFLSSAVLAKIAYEFLACHAGKAILKEIPQLTALRKVVWGISEQGIMIERMRTTVYRPLHGLAMEYEDDHAVVKICLFGWLVFRVHLNQLSLPTPHYVYTGELDTGEEYFAELPVASSA